MAAPSKPHLQPEFCLLSAILDANIGETSVSCIPTSPATVANRISAGHDEALHFYRHDARKLRGLGARRLLARARVWVGVCHKRDRQRCWSLRRLEIRPAFRVSMTEKECRSRWSPYH